MHVPASRGFHLLSCEDDPGFHSLQDLIIKAGPTIAGNDLHGASVAKIQRVFDTVHNLSYKKHMPERDPESTDDLPERVKDIVADNLGVERARVTEKARLVADLGDDSLDLVEIVIEIEKQTGADIPDDDAQDIQTVGDLITCTRNVLGGTLPTHAERKRKKKSMVSVFHY